jgi:hypothetical protein
MAASAEIQIQTSPRPFGATKNQLKVMSKMEFQETCGNTAYQLLLQNLRKLLKLKEEKVANPVTAFQPLIHGKLFQTTDIALVTRNQSSPREVLLIALTGLDKLMQMPDGSSSEVKETITALLAHKATLDTQLQEQANKTQRSTSMKSLAGQNHKNHGYHTTRELPLDDSASTTQNLFSTTELLMLAVLGLNQWTEKLSISSSDLEETTTALHAHRHTKEVTEVLLINRIKKSTPMRSLGIHLQSTLGLKSTRELLGTDTARVTRNQHSITEALRTAVLGLEKLIHKPNSSSSKVKETTIAHLVHKLTVEITPMQPKKLDNYKVGCGSIKSLTGHHQLTMDLDSQEEDSTAKIAQDICKAILPLFRNVTNGLIKSMDP